MKSHIILTHWRKIYIKTLRVESWWTEGMRWEECDLRGCNTGGGEGISRSWLGRRSPPPFAIQQASWGAERRLKTWQEEPGGGWRRAGASGKIWGHFLSRKWSREEVNNLAGGAWRGLEECWGIWENFRVTFGLGGGRVEQKWKLYYPNHLSCLYFVVSAWHGLVAKVLANKNEIKLQ